MTIHWIGTGLSSVPGLRRLLAEGRRVTVWNRELDVAQAAVGFALPVTTSTAGRPGVRAIEQDGAEVRPPR